MPVTISPAPALPPFVRLALRPLPLFPLQPALTVLLWAAVWRYPRIFDRLDACLDEIAPAAGDRLPEMRKEQVPAANRGL